MYLPIVDFRGHLVHYLPFVHVAIEKSPYLLEYIPEFDNKYLTSVQVIFVVDTVVSYYCIYYEHYLNRR